MKTAEEKFDEFLSKNGGNSLGSPINAAYEGFLAGYKEATEIAFKEGQSSPKIKQLEWEEDILFADKIVSDGFSLLFYRINIIDNTLYIGDTAKSFNTIDEAKSAAQKDFEARIKECLIIE